MSKDGLREATIARVVKVLRQKREKSGLSMNVVAQRSGLSQAMVSLVERDLRNPTLDTLLRISEVLRVDLGRIITNAKRAARRAKAK
ncbi:MAG: helix-turn-helix transcriptional regulator [Verrucomicrobiota bacterium]